MTSDTDYEKSTVPVDLMEQLSYMFLFCCRSGHEITIIVIINQLKQTTAAQREGEICNF